jgi:hypothetical protein
MARLEFARAMAISRRRGDICFISKHSYARPLSDSKPVSEKRLNYFETPHHTTA